MQPTESLPSPAQGHETSRQAPSPAWTARVDAGIRDLFQIATLLLGDERGAEQLLESAIGEIESDPCLDEAAAVREARLRLISRAVRRLRESLPGGFVEPPVSPAVFSPHDLAGGLDWAGVPAEQLRQGVQSLSPLRRTVFVMRVLAGENAADTVEMLKGNLGALSAEWTAHTVREIFRQSLVSLRATLALSLPPQVGV